ncbi:atlastin-3-like isoform X2 [Paramacrobiotus metropolitanus]|uniref:atlastin-3-like isoform X2 n=1 Tax=Paramacrobiotus metropolitanus TaxID=2943436 RepID=UPI0024460A61|nr:atlastin-3-like isoform X2 [Paramacrobiotus metropolitanus]
MSEQLIHVAVQNGQGKLQLKDTAQLLNELRHPELQNVRVSTVGIVGKYRDGKSTLLNVMHRFLLQLVAGVLAPSVSTYLYESEEHANRFITSNKVKGCTQGIWITKKPYLVQGHDGIKHAIFLLDTQGLFDTQADPQMDSSLFLLTSMLSSVTVFNVMRNFGRDQIDLLTQFSRLGSKLQSNLCTGSEKVFQDLIILMRDTLRGDFVHGWNDGDAYLKCNLKSPKHTDAHGDVINVYSSVRAFLLPIISDSAESEGFRLSESAVKTDFKNTVPSLLDTIFLKWRRRFQYKRRELTCSELADHLEHVFGLFRSGSVPQAKGILQVMEQYEVEKAEREAHKHYSEKIRSLTGGKIIEEPFLLAMHQLIKDESQTIFMSQFSSLLRKKPRTAATQDHLAKNIEEEFRIILGNQRAQAEQEKRHQAEVKQRTDQIEQLQQQQQQAQARHDKHLADLKDRLEAAKHASAQERQNMVEEMRRRERMWEAEQRQMQQEQRKLHDTLHDMRQQIEHERREREREAERNEMRQLAQAGVQVLASLVGRL